MVITETDSINIAKSVYYNFKGNIFIKLFLITILIKFINIYNKFMSNYNFIQIYLSVILTYYIWKIVKMVYQDWYNRVIDIIYN